MPDKTPKSIAKPEFSSSEYNGIMDLLKYADTSVDAKKSTNDLMDYTNGDAKKALSLIKDQYGLDFDVDASYAELSSGKKKVSTGLLEMPSQKSTTGAAIPSKEAKGTVETQLESALGSPELAKEAMSLGTLAEQRKKEKAATIATIKNLSVTVGGQISQLQSQINAKVAEYEKANPMNFPVGGAVPMHVSVNRPQYQGYDKDAKDMLKLRSTLSLLDDAQNFIDSGDKKTAMGRLVAGFKNNNDLITLGFNSLVNNLNIAETAVKANKQGINSLSEAEKNMLVAYGTLQNAQQFKESFAYTLGDGMAQSVPFMVQMLMAGGTTASVEAAASNIAKKMAERGLTKKILSSAIGKFVGKSAMAVSKAVVKGAAVASVSPSTAAQIAQERAGDIVVSPEGEIQKVETQGVAESLAKGYAKSAAEFGTEFLGSSIGFGLADIASKSKFLSKTLSLTKIDSPALKKIASPIGYSNYIGEFSGEVLNNGVNAVIDGQDPVAAMTNLNSIAQIAAQSLVLSGTMKTMDFGFKTVGKSLTKLSGIELAPEHEEAIGNIISQAEDSDGATERIVEYAMSNAESNKEAKDIISKGVGKVAEKGVKEGNQSTSDTVSEELNATLEQHKENPTLESATDVIDAAKDAIKVKKINLDVNEDIRAINEIIDNLNENEIVEFINQADDAIAAGDVEQANQHIKNIAESVGKSSQKSTELVEEEKGIEIPEEVKKPEYGAKNTLFTKDKYESSKKAIVDPKLTSGFDFNKIEDLVNIAGFHIEAGARDFIDFSKRMIDEFGEAVKPHLKDIWNNSSEKIEGLQAPTEAQIQAVETYNPTTDETIQEDKGSAEAGAQTGVEGTATENEPKVVKEKVEQAKPKEYAVQEQVADEGVLRQERPELELQEVGEGDAKQEKPSAKGEKEKLVKEKQKVALATEIGAEQKQTIKELEAGQKQAEKAISKLNEELAKVKSKVTDKGLQQSKVTAAKAVSNFFKEGKGVLPHSIYKATVKKIVQATPSNINKVLDDIAAMTGNVQKLQQVSRVGKLIGKLDPREGGNLASVFMQLKKLGVKGKFTYSLFKNPNQAAKVFIDGVSHNIDAVPDELLNELESVLGDITKKIPDVTNLGKFIENYGEFLNEVSNKNIKEVEYSSKKVEKMVNDLVAIQDMTDYDIIGNPQSDARKVSAFNSVINNLLSNGSIEITDKGDIEAATEDGKLLDPNMTATEIAKLNKGYAASKAIPNKIGYALMEITNELESSVRQLYKAFNPKTFTEAFGEETTNMVKNILLWMNDKTFKNTDISIPEWENLNEILNQINNNGFVPTALGGIYKYFGFVHKCTTQDENVVKAIEAKLESNPRFNDIGKGAFTQLADGLFSPVSAKFGSILGKSSAYVDDYLSLTQKVAKKLFPFYENMTSSSNEAAQKMQAKIDAMNAPMIKAVADLMMEHKSAYGKGYTFIVGMPENLDPKTTKSLNKVGMLMAALRSYDLVEGQYEDKASPELLNISDHFGNVLRRTGETEVEKQKEKFIKDNTYKYSTNEKENRLIKEQLVGVYEELQKAMSEKNMDAIRSREDLVKLLTPAERTFYEAVTDAYAKSQNDSFAAMLLNGEVYELENNYMPFQSAEQTEKDVKEQDVLASYLNRFTVSKASATKYKDPNIVKAINYNPYATFLRYSRDLSRNLYIQPEYYARKKALQFLVNKNKASKTANNVELKNVIDKFLRICNIDVDAGFRNLLNSRGQWWNTKMGIVVNGKFRNINPLKLAGAALNNMGIWHLVRIPRIAAEPVSQGFRVSPDTGISGLVKPTDSKWNAFADLNMETALTESSINKSITTPELRTTTGGFEKSKLPFAERVRLTGGAFKSVAAQQMALANRLTSKKLWTKAFNDAYKEFTGKDFDLEEYLNNEEYRFKADTDPRFVKAKRYANRTVEAKTSSLSKIAAPKSIVSWGTPKSIDWFGVEGFFGLLTVFGKYTKNMADETFMSFKRAYRFKDPTELKTAMANVSSNIAYAVIVPTITYGMGIAASLLLDDDDMFEDQKDKFNKVYSDFGTMATIQGASTLMAGGYNISKMVAASAWYIGHAWFGEGQFKKGDIESLAAINKYRRDARKLYEMYQLNQAFPNWYGEKGDVSFTQKAAETVLGNYMMAADAAGNTTKSIVDAINEIDKPNSERMLGAKLINAMAMTGGILLGVPFMKDLSIVSKAYIGNKWSSDPNFKRANADMQYTDQISSEAIKLIDESMAKGYERGEGIETIYNAHGFGDFKKGGMTHADNIEFLRKFDNYSRINEVKAMMLEASLKKNVDKYSGKAIDILRYEGFIVGCYIGSVKDEMVMQGIDTRQEFEERYSSVFEKLPLELKENAWQIVNMSPSRKKASLYKPSGLFYSIFPQYEIDQAMKGLRKKMIEVDVAYGKGV